MNPIFRPGLVLGLACLAPIAAGCQTLGEWSAAKARQSGRSSAPSSNSTSNTTTTTSSAAGAPMRSDAALVRTDFHREVTPLQEFNVHVEVGRAQESQERYEDAVSEYQKAIDATRKHPSVFSGPTITDAQQALAHRRMAASLDRLGKFAQSEVHFREALKLSPDDPKVWNDAGYSCYLQGRWEEAIRNLKMADSLDPGNPRVQTNLGMTLAASGKTDDALAALTRAGGHATGHANLAFLLAAQGKTDLARKNYQTALTLNPGLAPARQALAALDAKTAQAQTALLARAASAALPPTVATIPAPTLVTLAAPGPKVAPIDGAPIATSAQRSFLTLPAALPAVPPLSVVTVAKKPTTDPALTRASATIVPAPAPVSTPTPASK